MRGRKPKPTALRLLEGKAGGKRGGGPAGHRPLNVDEPVLDKTPPPCPDWLQGEAATEWAARVTELYERGVAARADWATLATYCYYVAEVAKCTRALATEPQVLRTRTGHPMPNPRIGIRNRNVLMMLKAAAELGITPSARSRVKALTQEPGDEFDEFDKGRRHA